MVNYFKELTMVICPWCGTNYTTFQSNCSRCGGPLTGPTPAETSIKDDQVTMPPSSAAPHLG